MKEETKKSTIGTKIGIVLRDLFTDSTGHYSCRLLFGSIGFLACIVAMFSKVDFSVIALMAPICAGLLGLSTVENVNGGKKQKERTYEEEE